MGKYRNREVIYKGIKFDSILERNAYMRLEFLGVKFYYHKTTYRIMTGYKVKAWNPRTKRPYISTVGNRHYTPEFTIPHEGKEIVIEMKGVITDAFSLRWSIFRKYLKPNQEAYLIKTIPDLTLLIQVLGIKCRIKTPNIKL